MANMPDSAKQMFQKLLQYLLDNKLLNARPCDSVLDPVFVIFCFIFQHVGTCMGILSKRCFYLCKN
jgi:hypothetical protein